MCLNVIVFIYFLFQVQSCFSEVSAFVLHGIYAERICENENVLQGETQFCKSRKVNMWAVTCNYVVKLLRKNDPYQEVYLHYSSFNPEISTFYMCPILKVEIKENYVTNLVKRNCPLEEDKYIRQALTICPASPILLEKNKLPIELPLYRTIAISVVPTDDEQNIRIMVFLKNEENNYIPFKWISYARFPLLKQLDSIPDTLFTLQSPTSMRNVEELHDIFYKNFDNLREESTTNILHRLDENLFFRLCVMMLRKSAYPSAGKIIGRHYIRKPLIRFCTISIKVSDTIVEFHMKSYPCYTADNYPNVLYRVSHGLHDNSVILHTMTSLDGENTVLSPVELIENISEEFLNEINGKKYNNKHTKCHNS